MFADDLRKSVLQAAVQGKLTEQLPTDGNALDLLKKIHAEKAKLIKAKKIKPITLPPISDDEIPFKIPANWCWVRLGDVCEYIQRGKSPDYSLEKKYPVISQKCNQPSGFTIDFAKFISADSLKSYDEKKFLLDGDLLWNSTGLGTVGRIGIYEKFKNPYELAVADSHLTVIRLFKNFILHKFVYFYIASPVIQSKIPNMITGSTKQKELNLKTVQELNLPLPPLAEQKRIVAKLDNILAEIELLAADERELVELEKNFPRQMKNSLLQAAIQGQLTEQLPADGNSRDLLKIIQAEKTKILSKKSNCVKSKKNKSVSLPPISDDELPFSIPANWCWVRLGDVCEMFNGNSISESEKNSKYRGQSEGLDFIATKDISFDNSVDYDNGIKIPLENNFKIAKKNSVLMCIEGGSAGRKIAIIDRDVCFGNKLCNFNVYQISSLYLYFYLQSSAFRKFFFDKIVGIIGGVGINKLRHIPIPLPPIAEQERLVARLDELLPLCEI